MPARESPRARDVERSPRQLNLVDVASRTFAGKHRCLLDEHDEVFPPDTEANNRGARIDNATTLQTLYRKAPKDIQMEVRGLATFLCGLERDDRVNGDPIWRHQKALVLEMLQCLLLGKRTMLMVEGTGTGKTRIQGIRIGVIARLIEAGLLQGNILVLVKRKALILQQAAGKQATREAVMSRERSRTRQREVREQHDYLRQQLGDSCAHVFPSDVWRALCDVGVEEPKEAERHLRSSLQQRGQWEEFSRIPTHAQILSDAALFLCRRAVTVYGPNEEDLEILEVSPQSEDGAGSDLFFDLSPAMREHLYLQTEFNFDDISDDELPTADTRIAVLSRRSLLQHRSQQKIADFLRHVRWIFVDEAGLDSSNAFTSLVTQDGIDGEKPEVLVSSAFNRGGRLRYDAFLSTLTVEQAINSFEQILQPQRLVVFPGNEEPLFPSGSYEAAEQFIAHYRRVLQAPKAERSPQPWEGPHLVVVDPQLVPYVVMRLRQEFGHTGTRFLSYDANRDEEHSARVQLRMDDTEHRQTCLVASMESVMDSFDWTKLRATFMCVHESSGEYERMLRLFGRQCHTREEGGYIVQQRFANVDTHDRNVWKTYEPDIPIPQAGTFTSVPGQYFLGREACGQEARGLSRKGMEQRELWASIPNDLFREEANREEGTFPRKISQQRGHLPSLVVRFPPLPEAAAPLGSKAYLRLLSEANGLDPQTWVGELSSAVRSVRASMSAQCNALRSKVLQIRLAGAVGDTAERTRARLGKAGKRAKKPRWITPEELAQRAEAHRSAAGKVSGAKRRGKKRRWMHAPAAEFVQDVMEDLDRTDRRRKPGPVKQGETEVGHDRDVGVDEFGEDRDDADGPDDEALQDIEEGLGGDDR